MLFSIPYPIYRRWAPLWIRISLYTVFFKSNMDTLKLVGSQIIYINYPIGLHPYSRPTTEPTYGGRTNSNREAEAVS
jgi:hypothetical protein